MKKPKIKLFIGIAFFLATLLVVFFLLYSYTLRGYRNQVTPLNSELADALEIFQYNQSQHGDLVPGCWYDSGDYIVVLPRNVESLFYLSLAHHYAESEVVKRDLELVIEPQLTCVEAMLAQKLKQFRDQQSHGFHFPPFLGERIYPTPHYFFREEEGGDVFSMLSVVYDNLGESERISPYKNLSEKGVTSSENCCEGGPLVLHSEEWKTLQELSKEDPALTPEKIWGIQFSSLLALKEREFEKIRGLLTFLENAWNGGPEPFVYLGGNYDIAGTIALERLYAKETGNNEFKSLSDALYAYLNGENTYQFNFTQADPVYHPCSFFRICELKDALINGIYHEDQTEIENNWQTREVQLVGQAQYALMKVVYLDL